MLCRERNVRAENRFPLSFFSSTSLVIRTALIYLLLWFFMCYLVVFFFAWHCGHSQMAHHQHHSSHNRNGKSKWTIIVFLLYTHLVEIPPCTIVVKMKYDQTKHCIIMQMVTIICYLSIKTQSVNNNGYKIFRPYFHSPYSHILVCREEKVFLMYTRICYKSIRKSMTALWFAHFRN